MSTLIEKIFKNKSRRINKKIAITILVSAILLGFVAYPIVLENTQLILVVRHAKTTDDFIKSLLSSYNIRSSNETNHFHRPNVVTGVTLRGNISAYIPGEPIHIFFWNGYNTNIVLDNPNIWKIEMKTEQKDLMWTTVFEPHEKLEPTIIYSGEYIHWVWNQKFSNGSQAPEGVYRVVVTTNEKTYIHDFIISSTLGKIRPELLPYILNKEVDANKEFNVIAYFKNNLTEKQIMDLMELAGPFNISRLWNDTVAPGFVAVMKKYQILHIIQFANLSYIGLLGKVHACLNTARYYTSVDYVVSTYGVTGDRDGSEYSYSKNDIVIAIVDSGIDTNHVDLDNGKVIGWIDGVNNFPYPYDDYGHGTHVASIAAGTGDGYYLYRGVAPGVALVGVKILDQNGDATEDRVIWAFDWILEHKDTFGIDIVVCAFGILKPYLDPSRDSIAIKANELVSSGLIVVAAAGNYGQDSVPYRITSPGTARHVITVGAVADPGEGGWYRYPDSSYGPTVDNQIKPDVVAPGVRIMAAKYGTTNQYWEMTGTSMATAFVAGLVALLLDYDYSLKTNFDTDGDGDPDVKELLMGRAIDMGDPGKDCEYGAGRVDAKRYTDYLSAGDQGANSQFASSLILWGEGQKWIYDEPIWARDTVDWYKVYVHGGDLLAINCVPETDLDIAVYLVDRYGHTITYVDPARGHSGLIEYNVPRTDYYFIKIVWQDWASQYDLYVSIAVS